VLEDDAELRLAARIPELQTFIVPLLQEQDYEGVLMALSKLHANIDEFFEQVMVMVEDNDLRLNRLALLRSLEALFLEVADISRLK
jgi:glycyl-tRNA synthetase beta chain